jgi:hypothetical protein
MRVVATTTDRGVVLSFTGEGGPESVALRHAELKGMTVPEAVSHLFEKLGVILDRDSSGNDESDSKPLAPLEYLKRAGVL